jgi:valyl-tRNA synthetase
VTGEAGPKRESILVLSRWPQLSGLVDQKAEAEIGWIVDLVTAIRSVRSEMNIPPSTLIPAALVGSSSERQIWTLEWRDAIQRLVRTTGNVEIRTAVPSGWIQLVVRGDIVALNISDIVDLKAERSRLEKELTKIADDVSRIDKKLGNADFMARAPEEVVEEQRERREEALDRESKVRAALERLKGAA